MRRLVKRVASAVGIGGVLSVALGWLVLGWLTPPLLEVPEARDWVFRDVVLIEADRQPRRAGVLRVRDGRLELRAPDEDTSPGATGDARQEEAPDLDGLFVVPGLVDMHVHYPPRVAVGNTELWSLLLLAHGVTSIRETGSIDGSIFDVRDEIAAGRFPGPRIFACGRMFDGEGPSFPSNLVVSQVDEARIAVREHAARGAICIKAYNMLDADVLAAIVETAKEVGLPVIGHKPHSVSMAEAGMVDLQHGTGIVPVDVALVNRQDFRDEDWLALNDALLGEAIRISRDLGIAHTPTLFNTRMRALLISDEASAAGMASDTGLRHLPRFWRGVWKTLWSPPDPLWRRTPGAHDGSSPAHHHFKRRQREMTAALHAAGVQIHAGTDTLMPFVAPGSSLHGELHELEAIGIATEDVLRLATADAGSWLGLPGLGRIEDGAPADLLFLKRDPRRDLGALRDIEAVLVGGRLYRRAELETALRRYDDHFHGAFYSAIMDAVVGVIQGSFAPEG